MLQARCLALDLARQTQGSASGSKLACMAWRLHIPMRRGIQIDSIFVILAMPLFHDNPPY